MKYKKVFLVVLLLILAGFLIARAKEAKAPFGRTDTEIAQQTTASKPKFNKNKYSLSDPASLWVIVNKARPLDSNYAPADLVQPSIPLRSPGSSEMLLRKQPAAALKTLVSAASKKGLNLMLVSGYRSYGLQVSVYNGNVAREGRTGADQTSARPGHSEHQTGLAADLGRTDGSCQLQQCFGKTPEGKWLAANAYKYGFVVRYEQDTQAIVGYSYEPWHLRFVGKSLATEIHKTNKTLEEFFDLPAAPGY